ncbi:hypothetical protein HAX54_022949 [Datura stramonium]|uniref:Uncharacterized protein n=1 Tax=Datura stramonium TaxID=4076 RepID=A0ABS8UX67_DATST|nr:hypothetical protein [Datura stramonium]
MRYAPGTIRRVKYGYYKYLACPDLFTEFVQISFRRFQTPPEAGKLTDISIAGDNGKRNRLRILMKIIKKRKEISILLVEPIPNGDGKVNSGAEMGNTEVEYVDSENLKDVEDEMA